MQIEARRAIRVPVTEAQHITFMLADMLVGDKASDNMRMITILYEDAAGEAVVNILPIDQAEEKLQTIYPGVSFDSILVLLKKQPRKEPAPVKRIITDLN